ELLDATYGIRARLWVGANDWRVTVRRNFHVRQLRFRKVRMIEGVKSVRIEMHLNCRPTCRLFTRQHVFAGHGGNEIVCFSHQDKARLARFPIWLGRHERWAVWVKGNRSPEILVWWVVIAERNSRAVTGRSKRRRFESKWGERPPLLPSRLRIGSAG